MNNRERQMSGKLYDPYQNTTFEKARSACKKFNASEFWRDSSAFEELKQIFKSVGEDVTLTAPFYCDHGAQISFGNHFYANTGLTILDEHDVTFGDHVFLGPHVSIYTACHPISAEVRNTGLEFAKPVTIGNNVWIGGNVVINPGVTIGNNTVIGSGSVVTKNLPDHVVAAGNPCRVIREIIADEEAFWKQEFEEYLSDQEK